MAHNRPKQYQPNQQPPQVRAASITQFHSGPLPHPEVLKGFEEAHPGAANRIIQMAEGESTHRRNMENKGQRASVNNERLGMMCALIVCLFALTGSFYCILHGHPISGPIVSAFPIGGITLAFIRGRNKA